MSAVVYRAYGAGDQLLYVGSTVNFESRMRTHSTTSAWHFFHERIETTEYASLEEARMAEIVAIATEHPRWNVAHRSPNHPDGIISLHGGVARAEWLAADVKTWQKHQRDQELAALRARSAGKKLSAKRAISDRVAVESARQALAKWQGVSTGYSLADFVDELEDALGGAA